MTVCDKLVEDHWRAASNSVKVQHELALPTAPAVAETVQVHLFAALRRLIRRSSIPQRRRTVLPKIALRWAARAMGLGTPAHCAVDRRRHEALHAASRAVPCMRANSGACFDRDVPAAPRLGRHSRDSAAGRRRWTRTPTRGRTRRLGAYDGSGLAAPSPRQRGADLETLHKLGRLARPGTRSVQGGRRSLDRYGRSRRLRRRCVGSSLRPGRRDLAGPQSDGRLAPRPCAPDRATTPSPRLNLNPPFLLRRAQTRIPVTQDDHENVCLILTLAVASMLIERVA